MKEALRILAAGVALTLLCACTRNEPTLLTNREEIAAHRMHGRPIIRGADQCVDEISRQADVGYGFANLILSVDRTGDVGLVDFVAPPHPLGDPVRIDAAQCRQQINSAIEEWSYRPFERDDRPIEVRIVEQTLMLPAERWRASPPEFPQISNPDSVVITLAREPGLFICERDHYRSYVLQIRGNGDVIIRGQTNQSGADRVPRAIDAPPRRFSIGRDAGERLIERFRAAHFFSLEAEYPAGITDQPIQRLTFETGTARASVLDYVGETVGMPLVVRDLEVAVDEAAGLEPPQCGTDTVLRPPGE